MTRITDKEILDFLSKFFRGEWNVISEYGRLFTIKGKNLRQAIRAEIKRRQECQKPNKKEKL
jgi:hypothetical protein